MPTTYTDRSDAGHQLADRVTTAVARDVIVLALPRGGVPVAEPVAAALDAPLDVIGVRKVGAPGQPELGVGAVAEGGGLVLDDRHLQVLGLSPDDVAGTVEAERQEVARRIRTYRGDRPLPSLSGRTVVVIDDGVATGVTATAACRAVRAQGADRVVLAAPVCAPSAVARLADEVDEVICLQSPADFRAVGTWYDDFGQTTDEEVVAALDRAARRRDHGRHATDDGTAPAAGAGTDGPVTITTGGVELHGDLTIPEDASGIVVFAHGSGSSRHSPRNRQVADALGGAGFATLLFDLLSEDEDAIDRQTRAHRFDIDLLAARLVGVVEWLAAEEGTHHLDIGLFGASTGAAAALVAAARTPDRVRAVVSRGGRPDLAGDALQDVMAPTLLVVGGDDEQVLQLNRSAAAALGRVEEHVVPGAGHLFEQPGALEEVADRAAAFFDAHLPAAAAVASGGGTR